MAKYIDKDAIVAEIKRRISLLQKEKKIEKCSIEASQMNVISLGARIAMLEEILSFLNTLEVKEVDLEKEIERFVKSEEFQKASGSIKVTNLLTKHFFELGLKVQKGE